MLKDTTASCPVIFNCQVLSPSLFDHDHNVSLQAGISRTTTAIVCGALVKELQLTRELDRMRGIVPDDILDALKKKKLGLPGIDIEVQEDRNAMQMGEFEVIKELLAAFPEAKVAKAQVIPIKHRNPCQYIDRYIGADICVYQKVLIYFFFTG